MLLLGGLYWREGGEAHLFAHILNSSLTFVNNVKYPRLVVSCIRTLSISLVAHPLALHQPHQQKE